MKLLRDQELADRISAAAAASTPPLVSDARPDYLGYKDAKIQPASVDLTIGQIFVPGTPVGKLGSLQKPRQKLSLAQGHTAVVRTKETLALPANIAAFGFPPSSVSLQGLLMTNPGHIDPGYNGSMHFTVINMAKKPFELRAGDIIATVLFVQLDHPSKVPYDKLVDPGKPTGGGVNEELLDRLSEDFMDIDNRATEKANSVVEKAALKAQWGGPIIVALIAAVGSFAISLWQPWHDELGTFDSRLTSVEARLGGLGADINLGSIDKRLSDIEQKVGQPSR